MSFTINSLDENPSAFSYSEIEEESGSWFAGAFRVIAVGTGAACGVPVGVFLGAVSYAVSRGNDYEVKPGLIEVMGSSVVVGVCGGAFVANAIADTILPLSPR